MPTRTRRPRRQAERQHERVSQPPRCPICGRFMARINDRYTLEPLGWRCVNVWYAGDGQWEHN